MNPRKTPTPRRALFAAAVGLGIALPAAAWAATPGETDYRRIVPRSPNRDLGAATIEGLCAGLAATSVADCPQAAAAKAFCDSPLDMRRLRPTRSDLDALVRGKCPVPTREAAPLGGDTKSAGLLDLGWQDALVRGLAGFLVERAKAEALAAAADRFRTGLCGAPAAKRLLPLTCGLLESSDPYSVPVSWGAVKSTAENDFHDLPLHLLDLKIRRRTDVLKDAPELLYAVVDITERVIAERQEPLPLLVGLQDQYAAAGAACGQQPTGCALVGAGITSEILLTGYTPGLSVSKANFIPIAVRLILDQVIALGLVRATDAEKLAPSWKAELGVLLGVVDMAANRSLAAKTSKNPEAIAAYVASLADIITRMVNLFAPSVGLPRESLAPPTRALKAWPALLQASLSKEYVAASVHLFALVQAIEGDSVPEWMRYLPLLAELAQAENPDQMKRIVESLAAPVGSYRGKRGAGNRRSTVNGYLGAQGGWEWLGGGGVPAARSFQGGVFAPIGLESSWGFGKASSLGLIFTVIDLGAVVNFRTVSETAPQGSGGETATVAQEPQIGLSQVFSPGLYALWGIPCTPLVLGVGGALTPELRRVTLLGSGAAENVTAFRAGVFLAVDVTIFPF